MRVEKFIVKKTGKVSRLISEKFSIVSHNLIQKMLRNKDIKINGKRISNDCILNEGDEVVFYFLDSLLSKYYDVIFEDENIFVINKKRGIEVVSETEKDLVEIIKEDNKVDVYAVHRLDRNTEGLVIFAKNLDSKKELELGFKNRTFEKYYIAHVFGVFEKSSDNLIAFLKKDEKKSIVEISDIKKDGFDKIQTNYKLLMQFENSSVIEVELVTGKTHQIRAHMAHIGHFIIGDEKYGDSRINKDFKRKYQNLISFKLILHFLKKSKLYYLNNRIFEIDKNKISFLKNL